MVAAEDDAVGTVLDGRYRLLKRLGDGGMGVVYRAERTELGRLVAVKVLREGIAHRDELRVRFERELRALSRLDHPNCVGVIDFGLGERPFIVMEHVSGETLSDLCEREGRIAPARALEITLQLLAGLGHAHNSDIIHRDVKPANVMLTRAEGTGDYVRILDFGLAKLHDVDPTASVLLLGTPSYMSPEQARARKVDHRADIYATGLVLFELLTGERAVEAPTLIEALRIHVEDPPPSLSQRAPELGLSEELDAAIVRASAKDPDERFQSTAELAAALARTPEAQRGGGRLGLLAATAASGAPATPSATSSTAKARPAAAPAQQKNRGAAPAAAEAPTVALREPQQHPPAPARGARGLVLWVLIAGAGVALYRWAPARSWLTHTAGELARSVSSAAGATDEDATAPAVETVAQARALYAGGEREAAIRALHELRRERPHSAQIPYLLGNYYADKGWWSESVAAYREALTNDRGLRKRAAISRNLVRALGDERSYAKARELLVERVGPSALAELRRAAKRGASARLRQRAGTTAARIARARRRRR